MSIANTYITVLSSDDYAPGVLGLCRALRRRQARFPLTVCATGDVSQTVLNHVASAGGEVLALPRLTVRNDLLGGNQGKFAHWSRTFDKLSIFGLTQFKKCVYLDSDMLVLTNLDSLFESPDLSAVCAGRSYPGNDDWTSINSGLMVFEPSEEHRQALLETLESIDAPGAGLGDQDVIQACFGWPQSPDQVLSEGYNVFGYYLDYYADHVFAGERRGELKVIHFVGSKKPWQRTWSERARHYASLLRAGKTAEATFTLRYETLLWRAARAANRAGRGGRALIAVL